MAAQSISGRTVKGVSVLNTISTSEMLKIYAKAYKEPPYGREVEGTVELLEKAAEELEKYHSLEEQCLLLRLSCKVGDTVWVIVEAYSFGEVGDKPKSWYFIRTENFSIDMLDRFGETVFLTRAEAEEKLRKLEGRTQ